MLIANGYIASRLYDNLVLYRVYRAAGYTGLRDLTAGPDGYAGQCVPSGNSGRGNHPAITTSDVAVPNNMTLIY